MKKLVAAKCPQCGADLELDDNMKKAKCEFCKSTIIVDEAIELHNLGTVKVSSVKDHSEKMKNVKKHLKTGKYKEAKEDLEKILEDDEYNIEALDEYVRQLILDFKSDIFYYDEYKSKQDAGEDTMYLKYVSIFDLYNDIFDIEDRIEMMKTADENGQYKKVIEEHEAKLAELKEDYEKRDKIEEEEKEEAAAKKHRELTEHVFNACEEYVKLDKRNKSDREKELKEHFNVSSLDMDSLVESVEREKELEESSYVRNLISDYEKHQSKERRSTEDNRDKVLKVGTIIIHIIVWGFFLLVLVDGLQGNESTGNKIALFIGCILFGAIIAVLLSFVYKTIIKIVYKAKLKKYKYY